MGSIEMLQYFILKFNLENTLLRRVCVYIIRLKEPLSSIELLLWGFIKFRLCDLCVSCVCQTHVEELPSKKAAMEQLNSRHRQITLPADRQKDIRTINTRWTQVSHHCEYIFSHSYIYSSKPHAVKGSYTHEDVQTW